MIDNEHFTKRLELFIKKNNLSIGEFETKCGISRGTVFSAINNKANMGSDKLARISATFPELNANWLLLGRGNMLLDCENNGIVQEEEQAEYKINHSSEMQIKLLEALIKEKDELIAEKERLIQILMKSNEKS